MFSNVKVVSFGLCIFVYLGMGAHHPVRHDHPEEDESSASVV